MDKNLNSVIEKKIQRTIKNLHKNNMAALYAPTKNDALTVAKTFIKDGDIIGCGGSMTLSELGIIDYLRSGNYQLLDRYKPDLTPQQIQQIYRDCFSANVYFTGSNAITEQGELFNVDGNSNRVAAMLFGPASVVVVVGYNKIVKDLAEAELRIEQIAAPANTARLNCQTPCAKTGYCIDCSTPDRICCSYVTMKYQRIKDRIKVIIVGEQLGY